VSIHTYPFVLGTYIVSKTYARKIKCDGDAQKRNRRGNTMKSVTVVSKNNWAIRGERREENISEEKSHQTHKTGYA
jgi:hypothetical protein